MRSCQESTWLSRRTSALVAGLVSVALVLSGCSVYDTPLPGGANTGDNPMTIKVMFRDVLDLVPQSTVRVNDVTVGKVKKVDLKGYVAEVTVEIPGDVKLPDNARAEIRQTSLLGEKFVQLSEPRDPATGKLANGDVIGLDRTGRNPEVEEVLGALSLLLNGGGVGQLKTIFSELNNAMEGREPQVRSVLTQLRSFMGQLDENKAAIIATIENTNRLALEIRRNDGAIKAALDDIPDALRSVDSQRADLVKLLRSLVRLSGVGVRVIRASKESTINSLRRLGPVLEGFAGAGDSFAKSFQVFLTYPFIDEAVGRNPRVARNLHMGDYTNLSVNLDLSVDVLGDLLGPICDQLEAIESQIKNGAADLDQELFGPVADGLEQAGVPQRQISDMRKEFRDSIVTRFLAAARKECKAPSGAALRKFAQAELARMIKRLPAPLQAQLEELVPNLGALTGGALAGGTAGGGTGGGITGGNSNNGSGVVPSNPLGRALPGKAYQEPQPIDPFGLAAHGLDAGLGTMLLQGVAEVR